MRSPLRALVDRFRREPEHPAPPPLPKTMALGAEQFRSRLDEARERLRRDIPPPDDDAE